MAGFAAALGGAAGPLLDYGNQVRQFTQQNRLAISQRLGELGGAETDPELRQQYLQGSLDVLSGRKDPASLFSSLIAAHAKSQQSATKMGQIVHDAVGPPPGPQPPTPPGPATAGQYGSVTPPPAVPSPIAGISPGPAGQDFSALLASAAPQQPPVAAQTTATAVPTKSDIQVPPAPATAPAAPASAPIPTIAALSNSQAPPAVPAIAPITPTASDPRAMRAQIIQDAEAQYRSATPAMRPMIEAEMRSKLDALAPFEQFAQRKAQFEEFSNTPEFRALPPAIQTAYRAQAFSLSPVSLPMGAMVPNKFQSTADTLDPAVKQQFGIPPDYRGPVTISKNRMDGSIMDIVPGNPGIGLITNPDGSQSWGQRNVGASAGTPISMLKPVKTGVNAQTGANVYNRPTDLLPISSGANPVAANLGIAPNMLSTTRTNSTTQLPEGGSISRSTVQKTAPGTTIVAPVATSPTTAPGATAKPTETPVPAMPGAPVVLPHLPKTQTVKPFDPTNTVDHLVQQIGNGDLHLSQVGNNAMKNQVEARMAQLGVSQSNITGSMRDRANNARLILGHLDDVNNILNQAEKDGDLGIVATRWNDFLTNKLGKDYTEIAANDPTKTHVFAKLSSNLGFLSTAVSMAHGGLRGGSSPTMVEHWEKAIDAKDPGTLRTKLGVVHDWMQGYAGLDQGLMQKPISGIVTPTAVIPPATGAMKDPLGVR